MKIRYLEWFFKQAYTQDIDIGDVKNLIDLDDMGSIFESVLGVKNQISSHHNFNPKSEDPSPTVADSSASGTSGISYKEESPIMDRRLSSRLDGPNRDQPRYSDTTTQESDENSLSLSNLLNQENFHHNLKPLGRQDVVSIMKDVLGVL